MDQTKDWTHEVLQRLIIAFLGLLTIGVVLSSCTAGHSSCAAYDRIQLEKTE